MNTEQRTATGVTRRRRRLSDTETEQRMLTAAMDMVNATGLTVSLEHISFEDVIRNADVARSAVYRRWPYKDLFFSDLLKEPARGAAPGISGDDPGALAEVGRTILDRLDWLKTPASRLALGAEILRRGALKETDGFHRSPEWRTYLALHATFLSLPDGSFRDEVRIALASSEHHLIGRLAGAYLRVSELLGLRLRDPGLSFETLAILASSTVRGLVIMLPTNPSITGPTRAALFDSPESADWSAPALALASLATSFLEPDPDARFDDERIDALRRTLESEGGLSPAGSL